MHRLTVAISAFAAALALASCQDDPTTPLTVAPAQREVSDVTDTVTPPQGPYAAVILDSTPGANGQANDINDVGDIVGQRNDSGAPTHAVLWHAGVMTDLGTLGGSVSAAVAINNHGTILGNAKLADGQLHAVIWQNGIGTDLGIQVAFTRAVLNSHDEVAFTTLVNGQRHAARWVNGQVQDLGTPGGATSTAVWINDQGDVVGNGPDSTGVNQAFVWSHGKMTFVPLPQGVPLKAVTAVGIDKMGDVVVSGGYLDSANTFHLRGWLWNGRALTLLSPPTNFPSEGGDPNVDMKGVTSTGIVFADMRDLDFGKPHPIAWTDGTPTMLDQSAIPPWAQITAINDGGVATGYRLGALNLIPEAVAFENGVRYELGVAGPFRSRFVGSAGTAVDRWGDVVGWSNSTSVDDHSIRPVLWRRTDVPAGHTMAVR